MHRGLWVFVIVFVRLVVIVVIVRVDLAGMAGLLMLVARCTKAWAVGRLHGINGDLYNGDLGDRSERLQVRVPSITTARAVRDGTSINRIWSESQCLGAETVVALTSAHAGTDCASFYTPVAVAQQGFAK
jgi:hypothetical protein